MHADFILIGQGISGTFFHWYLEKAGASCIVIDENKSNSASRVAAGLINPVTGRRLVKSWMIDDLMPFAWDAYTSIGAELNDHYISKVRLVQFFNAPDMQDAFNKKLPEEPNYLYSAGNEDWRQFFNYPFGSGIIDPCYVVNVKDLITAYRKRLEESGKLVEEQFNAAYLQLSPDHISYKEIQAKKIIFCDGPAGINNPWFNRLPYSLNKGEALTVHIPGLPADNIYKFRHTLIPYHPLHSVFWFGSNYEWTYADEQPSQNFRASAETELKHFLKLPYDIIDHQAAIRPANIERRPFVGLHPVHAQIGILNGMGTKGCSLAPYFAQQLSEYLVNGKELPAEVDVKRYKRVLGD
ncbi:MAG: FAD-binding oxidoreductase [Chitinophagaceae bacterium]